ncbi:allophanate hydrolase [Oxalobacteraceae bacterium A2-2]
MMTTAYPDLGCASLQRRYLSGDYSPSACVADVNSRIAAAERPEVWISFAEPGLLAEQAGFLEQELARLGEGVLARYPLFGLPFAVKDNIDVAGMATTAACPGFSYVAQQSAHVVKRLQDAGALLIGKTNLDQFATGLVGTRSPYGAVHNALNPAYVSGGSSSGSAVAVALGLVSFALGTDTAGSGRVPAGFNHIVGLKPTPGLISTSGVVPACRSLDCVSIFAASVQDAWLVTSAAAGYDDLDPYSRKVTMLGVKRRGYHIAVPEQLEFFGDAQAEQAFRASLEVLRAMPGVKIGNIRYQPFADAASLLYDGPWVAERRAAVGDFFEQPAVAMDPTVHSIIGQASRFSAVDAFHGQYRLAALKRAAEAQLAHYDFLLVPTTPTMPTLDAVAAAPVARNSELGYYTNFVNFFGMAALALPGPWRADGLPAGITVIGAGGADQLLAAFGQQWQAACGDQPHADSIAFQPLPASEPTIQVAVVGAHLEGQPLNWQLAERGARKLAATTTSANYRLYALADTSPPKPGLQRVAQDGAAIAIEVWELPLRRFGELVAQVPAPLGIGSLELADGRWVHGFICEPWALEQAQDITAYGGWRAYLSR